MGRSCLVAVLVLTVLVSFSWSGSVVAQQKITASKQVKSESVSRNSGKVFLQRVCKLIESAAHLRNMPPGFLARLIWKESRFNPNAVSPVGAQGIAQFMPGTARLRNLDDPFEPASAIAASAHYLSDLRAQFGNLGLAAAAYNAGPNRVSRWQSTGGNLPAETRDYVISITGLAAHQWNRGEPPKVDYSLNKKQTFMNGCLKLPIRRFKARPRNNVVKRQPWGGHVTADWSASKALAHYAKLQRKYPKLLAGRTPMVLRVVNFSIGRAPRYEVRVGLPSRAKAKSFCVKLKAAGAPCLVLKTPRS